MRFNQILAAGCSLATAANAAITLDTSSQDSIKSAASKIAANMVSYYSGDKPGNAPGLLPNSGQANGYGWWEGGEFFGALVDYWHFTGDSQYNAITSQALEFQRGEHNDYNPSNYSQYLGNDDISFWAMAAMSAVEYVFPDPPSNLPSWLALVQAVWNEQQALWDTQTCNGGLRWQRILISAGYRYKNSVTEGTFFLLSARLAKYTGNTTYLDWAQKTWDWSYGVKFVDQDYNVWDGASTGANCTDINHLAWTYNVGLYLYGTAILWNITQDDAWRPHILGLMKSAQQFLPSDQPGPTKGVLVETACETINTCNVDQLSFKSNLAKWMYNTAQVAPWAADQVNTFMKPSAMAAAAACSGGPSDGACGFKWTTGGYDGMPGVGQQINALCAIQGLMYPYVSGPVTAKTGGTSIGDPGAGTNPNSLDVGQNLGTITGGDRAGAGILTALFIIGTLAGAWWMLK